MVSVSLSSPFISSLSKFNPPPTICKSQLYTERGLQFDAGDTFFRRESATGRDLGVLSASLYKDSTGTLRVLDALCGCGIRSLRYLAEAGADFVLANDANEDYRRIILGNLSQVAGESRRWAVTHDDANRVMAERYLQRDYFDLIDIDSFGSDSTFFRAAIAAVRLEGLLYLTSTDGYSSGGHRHQQSLAAYGAYIRPMPYSNEIGLRMLIGGAVREASVLGYHVAPLFSYYSYHGPVFRVMLQVKRGKLLDSRLSVSVESMFLLLCSLSFVGVYCFLYCSSYGFIGYCIECGDSQKLCWDQLGEAKCPCNTNVPQSLIVSGPLWTGPLHEATHLKKMLNLAEQWEWISDDGGGKNLKKLFGLMINESNPNLPFGYHKMAEISSRAKVNSPTIEDVMNTLHKVGYAASRSHIAPNAIKTNCPMTECVKIVKDLKHSSTVETSELC